MELNFLEKEKRGLSPVQVIVTVFVGFLLVSASALWLQWSTATNAAEVAASEQAIVIAREQVLVTPATDGERSTDVLHALSAELTTLKEGVVPHGEIYAGITEALGREVTLRTFDSVDGRMVQVNGTFAGLDAVAAANERLQQLPYVRSARESDAVQAGSVYNAGIAIQLDESAFQASGETLQETGAPPNESGKQPREGAKRP